MLRDGGDCIWAADLKCPFIIVIVANAAAAPFDADMKSFIFVINMSYNHFGLTTIIFTQYFIPRIDIKPT